MKALLLPALAAAILVACGGDGSNGGGELTVEAREWSLSPSREEGSAGSFAITFNNSGTRRHELLIVKSDLPLTMLPTGENGLDEALVNVVARLSPIEPQTSAMQTVELTPGKYVLLCNVVETPAGGPVQRHYENGMAASFLIDQ